MTDRIFVTTDTFEVSDRFGDITVECFDKENITIDIDVDGDTIDIGGTDWARFNMTTAEFQAMFDWAKAQGIVK